MSVSISIHLDEETEKRLDHLSKVTGQSKALCVRKIIEDHIDDLEARYLPKHDE